jgi:hypothetical protein
MKHPERGAAWPMGRPRAARPESDGAPVSLLFPAFNRLAYTRESWAAMIMNTDWSLVRDLSIYDDGSTDGTAEWLQQQAWPECNVSFQRSDFHSPMGVTIDWARKAPAPLLAKIDNDTVVPPGWLNRALGIMQQAPSLEMLGLESMYSTRPGIDGFPSAYRSKVLGETGGHRISPQADQHGYNPAQVVSGIGLYRRRCFDFSQPKDGGYDGFEIWMARRRLSCGWIKPSLPLFLLDRMPTEPWASLSECYISQGWQRELSLKLRYPAELSFLWDWWKPCHA